MLGRSRAVDADVRIVVAEAYLNSRVLEGALCGPYLKPQMAP